MNIKDEEIIEAIETSNVDQLDQWSRDPEMKKRIAEIKEVLVAIDTSTIAEVPPHIGMRVQEAIALEQAKNANQFSWLQVAAAVAILILGFGLGRFSGNDNSSELMALKDEINQLKEVTLTSALQDYSASERIMAVNQIEEESGRSVNPELLTTLINTLNADESPNVRYAALQALSNYIDHKDVRAELVKSLEAQRDPLIQISLISILVEAEERSAIAPLKDIIENDEITPEVKQQAEIAIQVLT